MNKKWLLILMVLLAGCTMAPKYERPEAPVPNEWPAGQSYGEEKQALETTQPGWREFITDQRLREIIADSLKNNRDLRVAALNVDKARAMYGIGRASLLPSINASGVWYRERIPADLSSSGNSVTAEQFNVSLGMASWEIDFFGRIRSLKDQALEQYLATDQASRSAQILLVAAVAQVYWTLAADREALSLVSSTLSAQEAAYKMIRKRHEVGLASELDLRRAQTQVDTARGDVARYTQMVAQDENGLNLLIGSPVRPDLLPRDLSGVALPRDISAGLSSEPLLRRPDVLAAEHRLKAANANIGAARAALFPRISLTTSIGTASAELSGLFKAGSDVWTFAPQIVMPIFDPRVWYAYDVTKIEKEISIAQYEKSIQTAFREVADALAEKGMVNERIAAQQSLVDALAVAYRLSELRYEKGIDSYLSVLDAQRSLYGAQQGLILLRLASINNRVALYKALGGGASP
ncbi:MAG TPA: efflux transporter outer membrane subunit [Smithellaceae bacterium]|nr:efflux transporter outer membrane subunit [Smithellaceae bacterium]